jgi:hypothetical protein
VYGAPTTHRADTIMIKSADREVRALIEALGSEELRREAAVARLIVIGGRAVGRLIEAFENSPDRETRVAMLRVLQATGDDRAVPIARQAIAAGGDVAVAGVGVLQELLGRGALSVQADALDALVAAAGDAAAERRVRLAAAQAVDDLSRDLGRPGRAAAREALSATEAIWADAAEGHLPDDPEVLRAAIAEQGEEAPLPVLRRIIEGIRAREQGLPSGDAKTPARRQRWRSVRGALHQVLALRGSRIALYDLRETVGESGEPLPSSFLAALHVVGDESCLEPLATAFARAAGGDERWQHQLATAFHTVAKRERLTQKHSAMRRALAKSPALAKGTGTFVTSGKGDRHQFGRP